MSDLTVPTPSDIIDAARHLSGIVVNTPLVRSDALDELTGARVFLKLENLQHTGAFKFRGAYNCLSRLDRAICPDGVVAYSTGNHGQAVSAVGKMLNIPVTVVMPSNAPANKMQKARDNGARIVTYDRERESREQVAAALAREGNFTIVPPGDHADVIAGQGTAAFEAMKALGATNVDAIIVSCGGGGLAAGTCLAVEAAGSQAQVWAAEPAEFDDTKRSLASGQRETNPTGRHSICDALLAPLPAELPFAINKDGLAGVLTADDTAVGTAMRFAFEAFRVVLEPGGAVGLAALMSDTQRSFAGKSVVIVASGGNVDASLFAKTICE